MTDRSPAINRAFRAALAAVLLLLLAQLAPAIAFAAQSGPSVAVVQSDGVVPLGSPFSISAVGNVFDVPTAGYGGISYTLSGTFSATLMVEATNDPTGATGWYSVGAVRTDIRGGSSTTGGSVALGNYVFANNGARFRLRVATYTSGTITAAVVMLKDRPGLDVVYIGSGNVGVLSVSTLTETNTPLAASAPFTGVLRTPGGGYSMFVADFYSDVAGTAFVEKSTDGGTTWRPVNGLAGTALAAGQSLQVVTRVTAPNYRVRYQNGAAAQGVFQVTNSFTQS